MVVSRAVVTSSVAFGSADSVVVVFSFVFFVTLFILWRRFSTVVVDFIDISVVLFTSFATPLFASESFAMTALRSVVFFSGTARSGGGSKRIISDLISDGKASSAFRVGSGADVVLLSITMINPLLLFYYKDIKYSLPVSCYIGIFDSNVPFSQSSSPQHKSPTLLLEGRRRQPSGVGQGRGTQRSSPQLHEHTEHATGMEVPSGTCRPSFDTHSPP